MTTKSGQMLSHYRLIEKIDEDTVLSPTVAINLLPEEFARDPKRLARFQREARFLASLSHSNIAAIHGLEEAEGDRFLVLEHVPDGRFVFVQRSAEENSPRQINLVFNMFSDPAGDRTAHNLRRWLRNEVFELAGPLH